MERFDFVSMVDGEDWMMRPVMEGLCKYESLVDGTLSMNDLARMHEAIDVREENTYRAQQQQAKGAK